MKVAPKDADRFAKAPPSELRAALVYGPDSGLVNERLRLLATSVVEDLGDPFRVVELSGSELRSDPARLADEAAAISFTGGRRLVKLRATIRLHKCYLSCWAFCSRRFVAPRNYSTYGTVPTL